MELSSLSWKPSDSSPRTLRSAAQRNSENTNIRRCDSTSPMGKMIHQRVTNETVKELREIIEKLQKQYPDREVFFDGDEFAVCSRTKKSK